MGVDELTGLNLSQQFFGVSAHVTGRYLVAHDFALGVDDKGAPLGQTIGLNQHLEVSGDTVGGVSQHGVIDLLDPIGRIVPCFVDKMGVCGHGVNLTADGPELLVLVRQVLQLCRANEGEVSGIEEKYAPLAENIFLRYKFKIVLVERVGAKIGYLDRKSVV